MSARLECCPRCGAKALLMQPCGPQVYGRAMVVCVECEFSLRSAIVELGTPEYAGWVSWLIRAWNYTVPAAAGAVSPRENVQKTAGGAAV